MDRRTYDKISFVVDSTFWVGVVGSMVCGLGFAIRHFTKDKTLLNTQISTLSQYFRNFAYGAAVIPFFAIAAVYNYILNTAEDSLLHKSREHKSPTPPLQTPMDKQPEVNKQPYDTSGVNRSIYRTSKPNLTI